MEKIKIFLASSNELKPEREKFEIEIYRKCKSWFDKGIFLYLDIWEDLSTRLSSTGSQSEYNKFIRDANLFVFLAYSKVDMYSKEEFEEAKREGVLFHPQRSVKTIVGADGKVRSVDFIGVKRTYDENGRFDPVLDPSISETMDADSVILAIGQKADLSFLKSEEKTLGLNQAASPKFSP